MNIYGPMLFKDYDYQSNISKIPDKIPNNALISSQPYILPENHKNKLNQTSKFCTGVYLDESLKANKHFKIINEGLYNFFVSYYPCQNSIMR